MGVENLTKMLVSDCVAKSGDQGSVGFLNGRLLFVPMKAVLWTIIRVERNGRAKRWKIVGKGNGS